MEQTRAFEHALESVAMARRFAIEVLRGAPAELLETVALMVSELASNCVRHAGRRFDLSIILAAGELRVEATDHGAGEPCLRSPEPTDPTGRGLLIVDALAEAWGLSTVTCQARRCGSRSPLTPPARAGVARSGSRPAS